MLAYLNSTRIRTTTNHNYVNILEVSKIMPKSLSFSCIWYICDREQTSQQKFSNYSKIFLLFPSVGQVLKMGTFSNLTIVINLFVCLFGNSSQTIGPKGLKFSGFDGGQPGVFIRTFGEDRSKTLTVELLFQIFLIGVTTPENHHHNRLTIILTGLCGSVYRIGVMLKYPSGGGGAQFHA